MIGAIESDMQSRVGLCTRKRRCFCQFSQWRSCIGSGQYAVILKQKEVLSRSEDSASELYSDVKLVSSGPCSTRSFKQLMVLHYKT
jgi:hypothetical protein